VDDTEPGRSDDLWQGILAGTQAQLRVGRRVLKHLPADERCKLCAAPLRGGASPLMRLVGKGPWAKNPKYCRSCFTFLTDHRGGAEIDCSLLFADVRGSTAMAEGMRPSEVHRLMDRFFGAAARVLIEHDAIVDRFVGDQTIGIFVPALTGGRHAERAIAAARALLTVTGHAERTPWIPVGAGVHTGTAFVGCVGSDSHVDLTALGDAVNVAARLASSAAAGEILVTIDAARAGELDATGLERRDLMLKGKNVTTSVLVVPGAAGDLLPTSGTEPDRRV
jgi:adenylate cyclase